MNHLHSSVTAMARKTTYNKLERRIKGLDRDLVEREKELNCLYGLAKITEEQDLSLNEILQRVPSLLAASWQHPEIACARIVVGDREFATDNFKATEWGQAADIALGRDKAGIVEIYYLEKRPELDEGPFYKEERELLDAIAKRLAGIVEKKRLEEELKCQWEQFAAIVDNFADSLYVSDPWTYKVLLVNKSLERALGKNPVGGLCYKEFQGRDTPCDFCTNDIILRDKKPYVWEHYNPLLGKYLLLTDQIIRWPDGRQVRYEIAIDISERKRAEEERLLLATAIQQTQEAVLVADTAAIIQYVNPALEVITGYMRDELIGKDADEFLTGEHNGTARNPMQDVVRNGSPWSGRLSRARKDKTPYDAELTITPVRNASGAVMSYVAVERDVTREVKLERELRQSQKMEALGTLAGGIAHDFNNILMPITLNTELALRNAREPDKISESLRYVIEAAQRGRELVKQIISFSRQREKKREPVRIAPIIREVLKLLRTSLPSTIEMRENIDDDPSGVMLADATQIDQILMNLSTNAAHAMRERGGVLGISLMSVNVDQNAASLHADLKPGPYLRLTVTDTGEGMSREIMERIFEPFFTTKQQNGGTGMGLAVVHGIVKNHGGAITVYSEAGKGSTFNIFFPRISGAFSMAALSSADIPTGKERILLVDDEEPVLRSERTMLESLGYRVAAVAGSDEALNLFRAQPDAFDLVITDQTMPVMTGSELSRQIIRIRSDIPIILCTGFSEAIDEDKTTREGISRFVMKPFTTMEMAEIIRRVLDA